MKLQNQIDKLLARRASEWHQVLENADEEERAEFVRWLKQSPLHVQEYLETVYTDRVLKHVDAQRQEDVEALIAQSSPSVVPLNQAAGTAGSRGRHPRRWTVGVAAAAAVVVLCALLPFAVMNTGAPSQYATALGEQRTIELADSSIVTLNADSQIELHMDPRHRDVALNRGEAFFKVAHDAARPFTVKTHAVMVQAVGTQFDVLERPSGTRVSVLEGRVLIRPLGPGEAGGASAARATEGLAAGQEARVAPDGTIQRNAKADVMERTAWRERRLIFDDAPLEDVIYEFNRYNQSPRLSLEGVTPGSHHYNGIFDAADPDSLAELLSREPDLAIERRPGEIVIRRR
jgi:transmembrane sensor